MDSIVYIDQQSYYNLSIYDWSLLSGIKDFEVIYIGNKKYDYKEFPQNIKQKLIFNYSSFNNKLFKAISYFISCLKMIFIIGRVKPKIIHLQWIRIFKLDFFILKFFKKLFNCKIIFTVHNILPRFHTQKTIEDFRRLYEFCDALIVHTETTKKELMNNFGINNEKIYIIPHGCIDINIPQDQLLNTRQKLISGYYLSNKTIVTLLGAQTTYKGTDLLINAWKNNKSLLDNPNLLLVVAGKPTGLDFDKDISGNIIYIPRALSNEEFKAWLQLSDLTVLPYREIDQSGLLLSIVKEHIPYLCTPVGELNKPLNVSPVGWCTKDISIESISQTLEEALGNKEELRRKKNASLWRKIEECYNWTEISKLTENLYLKLIC